jgi:hypothetical protein
MAILTLTIAKQHLRVEGTDDDAVVGVYLGAAEEAAAERMGRIIYADADALALADDANGIVLNFSITAAVLLMLGHLYEQREDTVMGSVIELPSGSKMLLAPYRIDWLV